MKLVKGLLLGAIVVLVTLMGSCQALAVHDRNTRRDVLALVAKELPVGAPLNDMSTFLQRHGARFDLDDRFHHEYDAILPQSRLDKNLFDRKFGVHLRFDQNHRFTVAQGDIYHTFL